jgi:hypothetical protein
VALTRDEIKAKRGVRQRQAIDVPNWGTVFVAKMTARDRDRCEEIVTGGVPGRVNLNNVRAQLAALFLCNEDGTRMFQDSEADELGDLASDAVQAIVDAGFELNNLKPASMEESAKN